MRLRRNHPCSQLSTAQVHHVRISHRKHKNDERCASCCGLYYSSFHNVSCSGQLLLYHTPEYASALWRDAPSFGRCLRVFWVPLSAEQVTALLSNRRLPARGWDDAQIEYLLTEISLMDSNNFPDNVGVGEREGRVSDDAIVSACCMLYY